MTDPKPLRKRASRPKTKTGCRTCRIRKVKCDEGKPSCDRCIAFWGSCDGYDVPQEQHKRRLLRGYRHLLPATEHKDLSILEDVSVTVFRDEQEHRYFQTFVTEVAPRTAISGIFNVVGILTHLVPQACWNEPALRHGFVALGAMSMTQPYNQQSPVKASNRLESEESKYHFKYALERYQRALRSMQGLTDMRTVLLAVILTFCFESSINCLNLATSQIQNGCALLRRWLKTYPCKSHTTQSPAPSIIEDDLLQLFRSLSIYTWFILDCGPLSFDLDPSLSPPTSCTTISLPQTFTSISQARQHIELLAAQTLSFRQSLLTTSTRTSPAGVSGSYYRVYHDALSSLTPTQLLTHESLTTAYDTWHASLSLLWERACANPGSATYNRLAALRIIAHFASITQAATTLDSQLAFDVFLPQFTEIVELTRNILASLDERGLQRANGKPFEEGVILGLFFVALRCRERAVRGEAIELLRGAKRREGIWDSWDSARVVDFIRGVEEEEEEEGAEDGMGMGIGEGEVIPEEKRVALCRIEAVAGGCMLELRCWRLDETTGSWVRGYRLETLTCDEWLKAGGLS